MTINSQSLSSCLGGALSVLLRKTGKTIDALTVEAKGVRREQHPTSFEKITLLVGVKSKDITAMIKGNVEVETQITIEA